MLKMYDASLSDVGCEVIAVNNALHLLDQETSVAQLVKIFQENRAVISGGLVQGNLGSNPYSLGCVLSRVGMDYSIVPYYDLSQEGTYIVSYWNDPKLDSELHTIVVQSDGNGKYTCYNEKYVDEATEYFHQDFIPEDQFIFGYRVSNPD